MSVLRLNTGDLKFAPPQSILLTGGVGSCIVACLWDRVLRHGAMAHMCLPNEMKDAMRPGKTPETAIPYMLERMEKSGSQRRNVNMALVGGGNMFPHIADGGGSDVGLQILKASEDVMKDLGLSCWLKNLGGPLGRNVTFILESGLIEVRFTDGRSELLSFLPKSDL